MEAVDHAFIAQHTEGYDELKKRVFGRSLAQAAEICRIG
jgi:anaerobic selenocysteine-containing dehydrogenase